MHCTRRVGVLIVAAAVGLAGCASTQPQNSSCEDPDQAAFRLREAWQSKTVGDRCGPPVPACGTCEAPPANKRLLRRQGENLAYRNPRHVPTLLFAALTAYEANDNVRAAQHLDDVLQIQPAHPDAVLLRARIAMEEGNLPRARRLVRDQLALYPDHPELHESLASIRFLEGRHDEALVALDAAGRLGSPSWRVAYNRGIIEEGRGRRAVAIAHYQDALASLPNWAPPSRRLRGLQEGVPDAIAPLAPPKVVVR